MPLQLEKEAKTVVRNEHATVVVINGSTHLIEVRRPGNEQKGSEFKDTRDIKFPSLNELALFLRGVNEAYIAACKEVGITPTKLTE